MNGLQIANTNDKLILSIEKKDFSEEVFLNILNIARLEFLINKGAFEEEILSIDEELKAAWWQQNGNEILSKANKS